MLSYDLDEISVRSADAVPADRIICHPIQARYSAPAHFITVNSSAEVARMTPRPRSVAVIARKSPSITPATTASATPRPCANV
jgi:hypothetical protein